jgi:predicted acyl esterase
VRRFLPALVLSAAVLLGAPVTAGAAGVAYPDADWSEAWIPSAGGVTLHADVLRPKGATSSTKTPVIVSIGPYFNHSGQTGPAGPAEGTQYDPVGPNAGPSERFQDFVEGSGLLKKGYSFVMVDLRPAGLGAVVSQEPVYDDYRYLYGDGMRRENSTATPALYDGIAATPGPVTDNPNYNVNSLNNPACLALNFGAQALNDDHDSAFWKERNLIPGAAGSNVPLFLTQGLTENNTVADGLQQYLDNHSGYERAWLGPWEHVRGNETDPDTGKLKMGRAGWFGEVMRFYDRFLKGVAPTVADPPIAVQTNDGKWRSEAKWPAADATSYTTALHGGSYTDTALSYSTGSDQTATSGVWTISKPLPYDVHLSGSGSISVNVTTTLPRANLAVDVYDLNAQGTGPLITRQGHMVRNAGSSTIKLQLWSADWKLAKGHRIGVRVTDNNQDWWLLAVPTAQKVTVNSGSVTLPFLRYRRTETIQGDPGTQLAGYLSDTVVLPNLLLFASQANFTLPPALATAPAGSVYTGGYTTR